MLLALDFDGVLADSSREAFQVARTTFLELVPGSALASSAPETLYPRFRELMPLGNRAEDYGVSLAALAAGIEIEDQAAYDRYRASQAPAWLERFHRRFYEVRSAWAASDLAGWCATNPPFRPFVELLRRRAGSATYAIATSKDRVSVRRLLAHYDLADLFPERVVLDKGTGPDKAVHLAALGERLGIARERTTFVDDKLNHLDRVAPSGVRCALAAWGYNGPRERELARRRGYVVCDLETAEAQLFDRA